MNKRRTCPRPGHRQANKAYPKGTWQAGHVASELRKQNVRKAIARVPASTTNLGSGFDVLGLAVRLYSTVELEKIEEGIELNVEGESTDKIPTDRTNLAYIAAKEVFDQAGKKFDGFRITLTNGIPPTRGFGGSGTAVLGGLLTANLFCDKLLSETKILKLATKIEGHPDNISASLLGGFVVSCLDHETVHCVKLPFPAQIKLAFVVPDFTLSTKEAREVLPKTVPLEDAVYNLSRSSLLVAAVSNGNFELLDVSMKDQLHQDYRASLVPGLTEVFEAGQNAGALSVVLSGAGPTAVAFCKENAQSIALKMQKAFLKKGIDSEIKILSVEPHRAVVKSET